MYFPPHLIFLIFSFLEMDSFYPRYEHIEAKRNEVFVTLDNWRCEGSRYTIVKTVGTNFNPVIPRDIYCNLVASNLYSLLVLCTRHYVLVYTLSTAQVAIVC